MATWNWTDNDALWQMKYDNRRAASAEAYIRARLSGLNRAESNRKCNQEVPA
jgi:hypothetical protein